MCFVKVGELENINLEELLKKLKDSTITAKESSVLGKLKTHLVNSFNKRDNEVIEKLNLILEHGIRYEEANSPVAQFWLKGVSEEITRAYKLEINRLYKLIEDTYDDIFPLEYGKIGTTEDIYKIRDELGEKIDKLKAILELSN